MECQWHGKVVLKSKSELQRDALEATKKKLRVAPKAFSSSRLFWFLDLVMYITTTNDELILTCLQDYHFNYYYIL